MDKFNGGIGKDRRVAPVYRPQFIDDGTGGWQQKLRAQTDKFQERQGPPGPTAVATLRIGTLAFAPSLTVPAYLKGLGRQSMKCTRFTLGTILIALCTLFTGTAAWAAPSPQAAAPAPAAPAAPATAPATVTYTDLASWTAAAGYPSAINLHSPPTGISASAYSNNPYGSNGLFALDWAGAEGVELYFASPITALGASLSDGYSYPFAPYYFPFVVTLSDGEVFTFEGTGATTFFGFVSTSPITWALFSVNLPYWANDWVYVQNFEMVLPPITVVPTITTGPVNFGPVNVGANSTQTVVLSINRPLTLATLQTSGDYSVESDSCALNTPLANGTLCTLQVQFAPASPGPRWFPLLVTDGNSNTYSFGFEGTGVGSALAFTPGFIATVAGDGSAGYNGDSITATGAELNQPYAVAVDSAGNLYIADNSNNLIRKVNSSGTITTVAGDGTAGYNGDNIAATTAELDQPFSVAVDSAANLYIADFQNNLIRKVNASGIITSVAGNGTAGYNGDNITATSAELYNPSSVTVDSAGNLYIADSQNNRIRKVDTSDNITTVAGNGTAGYNGDSIAATSAELNNPSAVAVDSAGNLYIADQQGQRIRKVGTSGNITTVAGNGTAGYNGDNIAATSAQLHLPYGVAVDSAGNLYIADYSNQRIRKVNVATSALAFGSLKLGQTSGVLSVAASDVGNAPLNFSSFLVSSNFLSQDVGNDCVTGTPLAVGATCVLGAAFAPTMAGNPLTGELTVGDDAFNTPQSVGLSGISSIPEASLSASSLSFGNQQVVTTSLAQTVTVASTGTANLNISTVAIGGANAGDFGKSADTCTGATVTPNNSCIVSVTFTPGATGARSGSITITDNASNSPQTVSLTGTGIPGATLVMGPQAMEGNLQLSPGTKLEAGYDFTMPGNHPSATVAMSGAEVTFAWKCVSGSGSGVLVVPMADQSYTDALNSSAWFPSGVQSSSLVYQGSIAVPNACSGALVSFQAGGTFSTGISSTDTKDKVNVRWHYSGNGSAGGWSGTQSVVP